ncbi:MAG TPA: Ku protein [Polyangiaceae bacterium]|jgi:DNA end-binding protein Ku
MAARAMWTGSLAFGLVQIPVSLYGAEERDELSFTQLDRHDLSPIGYDRVNKRTGKKVAWGDIVRGYEYERGEYVVLSDEELKQANVEATHTIDMVAFVRGSELDPMYIERPLYVVPAKNGAKAHRLLVETLERTGRVGIGQVVLRTRQHLGAIVPRDGRLVLLLLRYAHELAPPKGVEEPARGGKKGAAPSAAERRMAEQLVEWLAADWDPRSYEDTYFDDVMALVKKKVASGRPGAIVHPRVAKAKASAKVVDLASLLEKSLAQSKHGKGSKTPPRRPRHAA